MTIENLAELEKEATPGPWFYMDGFKVENSHVIVADCSPGLADTQASTVVANVEFIASMRNHAKTLIEVASYARSLLAEEGVFEEISHFNVAFGLKDALERLEVK